MSTRYGKKRIIAIYGRKLGTNAHALIHHVFFLIFCLIHSGVLQFYTLMVQRFSLLYGASLATKLGDTASANKWASTANSMVASIESFAQNGMISEKQRTFDCSVILGALYGGTPNEFVPSAASVYLPSDADILNTTAQIVNYFATAFPLNIEDDNAGIPGTLLGRYKDDKYPGCDSDGGSKGHAWLLCSNALAELYYRNSAYFYAQRQNAKSVITVRLLHIISEIVEKDQADAAKYLRQFVDDFDALTNEQLAEIAVNIAAMFASQGDGQLSRVAKYAKPCSDHLSEQICESETENGGGTEIGAHDLTWSYGTLLSAMHYRNVAMEKGVKLWDERINERVDGLKWGSLGDCGQNICSGQCVDS